MSKAKTKLILIDNGDGSYDYDLNGEAGDAVEMMVDMLSKLTVTEAEDGHIKDLAQEVIGTYAQGVLEEMEVMGIDR
ncbi:MAG: hypothetical protein LUH45_04095 [Clostridiales bacterium]|nr:hypothetical protein [Clostridiales bacterium]